MHTFFTRDQSPRVVEEAKRTCTSTLVGPTPQFPSPEEAVTACVFISELSDTTLPLNCESVISVYVSLRHDQSPRVSSLVEAAQCARGPHRQLLTTLLSTAEL